MADISEHPIVLGVMTAPGLGLAGVFRRFGWLRGISTRLSREKKPD